MFQCCALDTDSDFIFTDEKVLHVTSPVNTQKDRVYAMSTSVKLLLNGFCVVGQFFQVADGFSCRLKAGLFGAVLC